MAALDGFPARFSRGFWRGRAGIYLTHQRCGGAGHEYDMREVRIYAIGRRCVRVLILWLFGGCEFSAANQRQQRPYSNWMAAGIQATKSVFETKQVWTGEALCASLDPCVGYSGSCPAEAGDSLLMTVLFDCGIFQLGEGLANSAIFDVWRASPDCFRTTKATSNQRLRIRIRDWQLLGTYQRRSSGFPHGRRIRDQSALHDRESRWSLEQSPKTRTQATTNAQGRGDRAIDGSLLNPIVEALFRKHLIERTPPREVFVCLSSLMIRRLRSTAPT